MIIRRNIIYTTDGTGHGIGPADEKWNDDVWTQNVWYGYSYFFLDIKTVTPETLFSGIRYSHIAYKLLREKRAFLLLFYYYFKKLAWVFGFMKGYEI